MKVIHSRNPIIRARRIFKESFEKDPNFKFTYESAIAMLLHDRFGGVFKDYKTRNDTAKEILKLLFWS